MKVLSIKYQFCGSVDPVTYDSFDIKDARSLEAMVQTHLASGSLYLELYGMTSTSSGWQSTSVWRHCETSIRRDDILPTMSTDEGTFYVVHDDGSDNESDVDPPREAGLDGAKVALFSEPELVPTIPEDVEGGSDNEEEDLRFRAYSPPTYMHNVDLSQDDVSELPDLPHRRRDHPSSLLDSGELEVGKDFSNKDSFLGTLKQHSITNGVNYNVVKSKFNKFEAKCAVQDGTCSWKIMVSLRKKTGLWEIKKYKNPHTCVAGVSEDHSKMNSDMLATLIPLTVKADPRTLVPVLIANIRSQLKPNAKRSCMVRKGLQEINKAKAWANTMHTVYHDQDNLWFRVTEFDRPHECIIGGQYHIHLRNKTCDCGRFNALRYPCAHIIAACQNLRLDLMSYVDRVYKLETIYNVWRHVFSPIPDELDLVMGVGRVTHLDRIMTMAVFASSMAEVLESRKVIEIGRKKSSPMVPRAIPHVTVTYRSEVDSE
ncbi:hypothetical protein GOBAR_AA04752 [Gossypium barbadense]|uniref:SWIM-type domain-containing protein n=1 Tax=Gossypium barbadense TaxID=3634 RepID=A0A2P5YJP8_GOSBA|nr:hypothetical protein GOBAR_AA04752 [Gossypium barbadense]